VSCATACRAVDEGVLLLGEAALRRHLAAGLLRLPAHRLELREPLVDAAVRRVVAVEAAHEHHVRNVRGGHERERAAQGQFLERHL
jgi:hypothetical protein